MAILGGDPFDVLIELLLDVARLRRLNDNECPLILANQWLQETQDLSGCARTLVLQESQNGDIPVSSQHIED